MVFDLAQVAGYSQRSAYDTVFEELRKELTDALKSGPKRLLATYLQRRPPREPARRETTASPALRLRPLRYVEWTVHWLEGSDPAEHGSFSRHRLCRKAARERPQSSSCSPAHGGKSGS